MNNPKISVVMSVYNGEKFLKGAINSILSQTFTDFEFIIINDGSTDKSLDTIKTYQDPRIKIISRENKGLTHSLNEGIKMSKGSYIARMDADDISLPTRLEEQIKFLELNKEIAICGTWAKIIDEKGEEMGEYKTPINNEEIKRRIIFHNPFIHPSVMFKKEIMETVGLYNPKLKHVEDYELWTRIVSKFKTANIPQFLLKYRQNKTGITSRNRSLMLLMGFVVRFLAIIRK
ncbi:MAG: glycosyltransferase [Candidatus Paceibacterota bacterium]|jgi:glycosyltransferase involved in cell wall biosynthesis